MCANYLRENVELFKDRIHAGMLKNYDPTKDLYEQYVD